jgi:hypothetical protein
LARPWECIWSIPNQSRPENPNSEVDAGRDNHPSEPQRHSALTTVLLDDSAVKAVLQPWNILCVSEYRLERCNLDIKIALRERERKWRAQQERKRTWPAERNRVKEIAEEEMTRDGTATDAAVKSSEETTTDIESNEAELKRKRKEKRLFELNKLLEQLEMQGKEGVEEEERYDELLLAVIGVLDALKHVGNVAGWMRGGGLVRVVSADQEAGFNSSKRPIFIQPQTLLDQATGVPSSTAAEAAASSTTPTETSGNNMTSGSTPTPIPHTQFQHLLWHKRPCVLSYWVQRGRKALSELGIDIIDGVGPYSGLELGSQMQRKF